MTEKVSPDDPKGLAREPQWERAACDVIEYLGQQVGAVGLNAVGAPRDQPPHDDGVVDRPNVHRKVPTVGLADEARGRDLTPLPNKRELKRIGSRGPRASKGEPMRKVEISDLPPRGRRGSPVSETSRTRVVEL